MASWSIMRSSYVTFFLLHNKLLQVAIWMGPWNVSLSRVLTTWQTSVCWSVIYLCEAVSQGVWYFGSTLCTRTNHRIKFLNNRTGDFAREALLVLVYACILFSFYLKVWVFLSGYNSFLRLSGHLPFLLMLFWDFFGLPPPICDFFTIESCIHELSITFLLCVWVHRVLPKYRTPLATASHK